MAESPAAAAHNASGQRKNKRNKLILYFVLFAIFHAGVIAVFSVTILKVRTPRFGIRSATFGNFSLGTSSNPMLSARMNAQFTIRNRNFGRYRYHDTTVQFLYRGTAIGQAIVGNSHVGWRSTRRFAAGVDLNLGNGQGNGELVRDLSSGVVQITSQARMRGRVELLFVLRRKNRAASMNCSMEIVTATQQLTNIVCN